MTEQEILYTMALTRVPNINLQNLHILLDELGSATAVFEHRKDVLDILPQANKKLLDALALMEIQIPRAEEELKFTQENHIQCLCLKDDAYPIRMRECPDAPLLVYYKGNANLNARHVLAIVGTRQITEYGKDLCMHFVRDLGQMCPDALIISGLAYGVDIHAQRAALDNGLNTVGVVAHGLDQIYPRAHQETARKMLGQGGLLTEFMSRTNPDKKNFVQRNRIVAGISDCAIIVESALKGGSLITAEIADSYHRDVFAFPGRVNDNCSKGCNELIRSNRAQLIGNAEDFIQSMGWESEVKRKEQLGKGIQQQIFLDLSEDEQKIVNCLQKVDNKQINIISVETGISIGLLSSLLFNLEMKGVVKMMNGGMYRLL